MLTACTSEEEDMGVQLLGKKCFKTHHEDCDKVFGVCTNRAKDFHCCYESVISRIIMEQAIVQLGWSAKDFRNEMGCR
ncbi:conjugal transfer protein TraN, partial [Vibrio cholerae]